MATVGQLLTAPEAGWRRFEETSASLQFIGTSWTVNSGATYSGNTGKYTVTSSPHSVSFKFVGTKLRIISYRGADRAAGITVAIDGVSDTYSSKGVAQNITLLYEKTGLSSGTHTVTISYSTAGVNDIFEFDAIDIDDTGYLVGQIGVAYTAPEAGWRRYDASVPGVTKTGTWIDAPNASYYNGSNPYTSDQTATATLKFYGTKIRVIGYRDPSRSATVSIAIDGITEVFSQQGASNFQILEYEKVGLSLGMHTVKLSFTGQSMDLDAVDVDATGILGLFPATTGQLRTRVQDMQIGDFIPCNYVAGTSGAVGSFSDLGGVSATSDIPVAGSATPKGAFYLVKVDKGLLVSDRAVQHSINADTLNSGRLIQGKKLNLLGLIPVMTSATTPSGAVSASVTDSTAGAPYLAFNGTTSSYGDRWFAGVFTVGMWIQYQFPTSKVVTSYSMTPVAGDNGVGYKRQPKDFTFSGSNDGSTWTVLDTRTGVTNWVDGVLQYFDFSNKIAYMYYRITVNATNGDGNLEIGDIQMYSGTTNTVRSLTGGVAYADANGKSIATDQSKGSWPQNNEWDKYIVNFPVENIQTGKTVDDMFHYNGIWTLCQDTPVNGLTPTSVNNQRVQRGNTINQFAYNASSFIHATLGFRPVFEYKE